MDGCFYSFCRVMMLPGRWSPGPQQLTHLKHCKFARPSACPLLHVCLTAGSCILSRCLTVQQEEMASSVA